MPFPNFHACRLKNPNLFESGSFRTLHTKTKGLTFISGKLKSTGKSAVQSFRYDKKVWTATRASNHCKRKGGNFEAAVKKILKTLMPSDIPELLTPGANTAFQGKGQKGLAYKLCIIENKERGKTETESKEICSFLKNEELNLSDKLNKHEQYLDLPEEDMTFVYHHHWRDIEEYEAKCNEEDIGYDNTLFGELKLNMGKYLLGYTIHLGEPSENFPNDKLVNLEARNKLEVSLNEKQTKDWLLIKDTSIRKEVDKDHESWSAYYIIDKGKYKQGVKRKHFQEYFLDGNILKGRFIFIYAPVNKVSKEIPDSKIEQFFLEDIDNSVDLEERVWLVQRPSDQRPYAETHKLEDVVAELKQKKQKWLVWSSPNTKIEKIDIEKFSLEKAKIDLFTEKEV